MVIILQIYYINAKWSNDNTRKKSNKYSGMLGEDENMIREFLLKHFEQQSSKLKKRLLPGPVSGETDCRPYGYAS